MPYHDFAVLSLLEPVEAIIGVLQSSSLDLVTSGRARDGAKV